MRAQWRARRFALGAKRIQYIADNRIMEEREIKEKEVNEGEWKMKRLEEGEQSRLEKEDEEGSIEEENEIKERNGDESKDTKSKDEGNEEEEERNEENGKEDRVKNGDESRSKDEGKDEEECIEEENGEEGKEKMKEENGLNNKQQNEHNNEDDKEGNVHETDSQNEDSGQNYESESISQYILDTSPTSDHPVTSVEINMKDLPQITIEEHPVEEKGLLTSQQTQLSDNISNPVVQKVHSHHSTIQDIIYNSGNELETLVYSSRGEVPGSVIQDLLYPDRLEIHQVKGTRTTRGKPPPTTIQKLIHGVCVCSSVCVSVCLCICLSVCLSVV